MIVALNAVLLAAHANGADIKDVDGLRASGGQYSEFSAESLDGAYFDAIGYTWTSNDDGKGATTIPYRLTPRDPGLGTLVIVIVDSATDGRTTESYEWLN